MDNKVIKIEIIKGCMIHNNHNNHTGIKQDVMIITYKNGDKRILDMLADVDITDCDYLSVIYPRKKSKVLFEDYLHTEWSEKI